MHGKISFYSAKSQSGTIIDKNKRIYELRASGWHDLSTIPTSGLYVTFRLDDNGRVSDCKASKYQDFKAEPYVCEAEFWDSEDDEALEEIEETNLENAVMAEVERLDVNKLDKIETTKSPEECFKLYFRKYTDLLDKNRELLGQNRSEISDFFILKKYTQKALSQLLSIDRHISENDFMTLEQSISEVESAIKTFRNNSEVKADDLFKIFERYQLKYLAAKKKLISLEDEKFEIDSKIKSTNAEIERYRAKSKLSLEEEELIGKKSAYLNNLQNRAGEKRALISKVRVAIESFEKGYMSTLPNIFTKIQKEIFANLRFLYNALGNELDNKIHKTAMISESVINTYYKHNFEFPFCTMTFLRMYLKRLDKSKMQPKDVAAFNIYTEFERTRLKKYLLITDSETIASEMRRFILSMSKNNSLYLFHKPIEFFTQSQKIQPEVIIIDLDTRNLEVEEILQKTKSIFGSTTRVILFNRD